MAISTPDTLRAASSLWWLIVLFGILVFGVGVFFVISPHETLKTFTVIAGIVLLVDGIIAVLVSIFGERANRGLLALVGVLSAVAGLVLIKKPFETLVVLVVILGIWLVVAGGVRFVASFALEGDRAISIFVSLLDIVIGIVILSWPKLGLATLAVILGIGFILRGILLVYEGWVLRTLGHEAGGPTAQPAM
jgi:uncharacterized membrane protein HdeD (DUF308 family)